MDPEVIPVFPVVTKKDKRHILTWTSEDEVAGMETAESRGQL